ncbi:hypothetical protein ACK9YZ_10650 [Rhizobium sp. ZK1]|uniref:hypothetical protein n=1 Tax=Rhizobium sp. ZK1 TaxID=3389872 RepID=UPI0039F71BD4
MESGNHNEGLLFCVPVPYSLNLTNSNVWRVGSESMLIVTLELVYEIYKNQYFKLLSIPAGNRLIASGGY